ncbi:MAG: hypothetical protein HWE14_09495 [Flavobacteriia bacterium]|nr:hypothetical protein [Flavobacteriia bacterium]
MKLTTLSFFIVSILLWNNSHACTCAGHESNEEANEQSDIIIYGRVVAREFVSKDTIIPDYHPLEHDGPVDFGTMIYSVIPHHVFKGIENRDTLHFSTGIGWGDCGIEFRLETNYLIFGRAEGIEGNTIDSKFSTDVCTRTQPVLWKELPALALSLGLPVERLDLPNQVESNDSALFCAHPDTSMGSFFLGMSNDKLASFVEEKGGYRLPGRDIDYPNICAVNPESGLEAILLFYPGSSDGAPSYIILREFQDQFKSTNLHLDEKEFVLSRGAYIGMTEADFFDVYPKEAFVQTHVEPNRMSYSLKVTEKSNSPFLNRRNMPEYTAEYLFEDDLLVEVRFGLVMP